MLFFIDKERKVVLATNYKVMYSSIYNSKLFTKVSLKKALLYIARPSYRKVLLTRSPYKRLESFYKDKIEREPKKFKINQNCQSIILNYFSIEQDVDTAKKFFESFSFENFVLSLPNFYYKDQHLTPQTQTMTKAGFYFGRFFQMIDIDNVENKKSLRDLVPDVPNKFNETMERKFEYTAAMRVVVERIYANDFEYLKY